MSTEGVSQPDTGPLSFLSGVMEAVQAVAPGLSLDKMIADTAPVLGRMADQGAAELGAALFQGQAYVPYGDGQKSIEPVKAPEQQPEQQPEIEM